MTLPEARKQHLKALIEMFQRDNPNIDGDNLYDFITSSMEVCMPDSFTAEFFDNYLEDMVYLWVLMEIGQLGSLSLMISHDKEPNLMVSNLIRAICNSIYSILHLSINGLDYSTKIILRILMEQYMILLSTTVDKDKRADYINAWESDDATKAWYRNFSKKKFVAFIDKYFSQTIIDQNDIIDWIERKYSHYSGYVHNDYPNIFLWSYADIGEDKLKPNLCGEYITRKSDLLYDCFHIAFCFDLMFLNMLKDPNIDLNKTELLNNNLINIKTIEDTNKFKSWIGMLIILFERDGESK